MTAYINPILALAVITIACIALITWQSPGQLRRVAVHLLTRADVIDGARALHVERMRHWSAVLKVKPVTQKPVQFPSYEGGEAA